MNTEARLTLIKENIHNATIQRAKLEQELETAQVLSAQLHETLKEDFNVETLEQAKKLLVQLNAQLTTQMTEAESQLGALKNDS